jgi:hypothetical protein
MTPQAQIKARFAEVSEAAGVRFSVSRRKSADGTNWYVTVFGGWEAARKFLQGSFPEAWVTSGSPRDSTYGVPPEAIETILLETEFDPAWLRGNDSTALRLAQAIRDERAFDRLPILADALEDAGCTNTAILEHCRATAPHAQTCWVVELLLSMGRKPRGKP